MLGAKLFKCVTIVTLLTLSQVGHARQLVWTGCGIAKLGFMEELAAAYKAKSGVELVLRGGGATKGIRDVAEGQSDLGGSCRMPLVFKDGDGYYQVHSAEAAVAMIPVGWDVLTPIVHPRNPWVSDVSREQLRAILTGQITHWFQLNPVAPPDRRIHLYVRAGGISGVGLTLRQQLFNDPDQVFSADAQRLASSGKIEEAVEGDVDAFAVSGVSSSRHRTVRMLNLDGQAPTMQNLSSGKYALYRILFLTAPADYKRDAQVKAFVDFALSAAGQKVIRDSGTLPYQYGLNLLRTGASDSYLQSLDVLEQSGLYLPNG